ncbi:hypothetical protein EON62_03635 [archaeon]|nr:MAG: hypothetical protein EON62_03635 [archaeon]
MATLVPCRAPSRTSRRAACPSCFLVQHEKYQEVHFGRCSRVYCQGQPLLPAGLSDLPRTATVVLYCPRCNDVYYPKASRHTSTCACTRSCACGWC